MDKLKKAAVWLGSNIKIGVHKTIKGIVCNKRVKKGTKIERFQRHDSYAMPRYIRSLRVQRFLDSRRKESTQNGIGTGQFKELAVVDRESAVPFGSEHRYGIGPTVEHGQDSNFENLLINDPSFPSQMQDCWKDKYPGTYRLRRNPGDTGGFLFNDGQIAGTSGLHPSRTEKKIDILIPIKDVTAESSQDELVDWRSGSGPRMTSSDYFLTEGPPPTESDEELPSYTTAKVDMHDYSATLTIQEAVDDVVEVVNNILGESLQQVNVFSSSLDIREEPIPIPQDAQDLKLAVEITPGTIVETEYKPAPSV